MLLAPIVSGLSFCITMSIALSESPGIGTRPLTEVTRMPFFIFRRKKRAAWPFPIKPFTTNDLSSAS